jgi:hypothetical protein
VRKAYRNVNGGNHASKEEGSEQEASSEDNQEASSEGGQEASSEGGQEASSEDNQEASSEGGQEALGATDAALTTATISTAFGTTGQPEKIRRLVTSRSAGSAKPLVDRLLERATLWLRDISPSP